MPVANRTQLPILQGDTVKIGPSVFPAPYWRGVRSALYLGDVRACLRALPPRSVHCTITSPPYWGLRDYGTAAWEGGDAACDHMGPPMRTNNKPTDGDATFHGGTQRANEFYRDTCAKCGARRTDMQLGMEPSPDCGTHGQAQCGACFVCSMVSVMREVWRVLRDDGTLWLNLGDTYTNGVGEAGRNDREKYGNKLDIVQSPVRSDGQNGQAKPLQSGNLVGIPWRVALALQVDGWILRQDIIWHSPNKMPESVRNRCTKSHEYIFLLAKSQGYYYDAVAIEEPSRSKPHAPGNKKLDSSRNDHDQMENVWAQNGYSNKRDVWTIDDDTALLQWLAENAPDVLEQYMQESKNKPSTWVIPSRGYRGAHFAVFSPQLITPCILAGTSEYGCCADCGKPYERVVDTARADRRVSPGGNCFGNQHPDAKSAGAQQKDDYKEIISRKTVGWQKVCGCATDKVTQCVVLDPFIGSGTTVATALDLGRAGIGIDLSEKYLQENAIPRITGRAPVDTGRAGQTVIRDGSPPAVQRLHGVGD